MEVVQSLEDLREILEKGYAYTIARVERASQKVRAYIAQLERNFPETT